MNMTRKGQVQGVEKGDVRAQVGSCLNFLELPNKKQRLRRIACPQIVFATQPRILPPTVLGLLLLTALCVKYSRRH